MLNLFRRMFLMVSGFGALVMLVEAVLQLNGSSICSTEGCKVVAQYSRYGDVSIVILGFGALSILAALAFFGMHRESSLRERAIDIVLIAALAAEGFFVGYQLFWLRTACVFCLSAFGIFAALGILRIASGRAEVLAGFGALALLFALFYLLLPPGGIDLPSGKYVLFYSPDCRHCTEIRKELDTAALEITHVQVKEYAATLKTLGIESVPTLLVNGPYEKIFLTGTDAIRRYLDSCRQPKQQQTPSRKAASRSTPQKATGLPDEIFTPYGAPDQIFTPPQDDGLCKENKKCD